ncbi:MAG: thioesterase family protein [Acidimicrobiia bacterium]|nr:MAG: thioesterase family protein [Acidimicrobiia bacterium]
MTFAAATALRRLEDGVWEGSIAPGWDIAGAANGGYLLAIAARAASLTCGRIDPVTVTAHYLAPGKPGRVTAHVEVVKSGRRFATVSTELRDASRPLLRMLGSFSDLDDATPTTELMGSGPPDLPPVAECLPVTPTETFPPPFMGRVDLRLPAQTLSGWGEPGPPRVAGWFRLGEAEPMDTTGLLVAVDAFPPTIFFAGLPVAWVPTLELTAHIRARPAPGWLRGAFSTRFVTGGFLEEDGEVWDSEGRLVAQSRQLALLPRT